MTLNHILAYEKALKNNPRLFWTYRAISYLSLFIPRFRGKRWINRVPTHVEAASAEGKRFLFQSILRIGKKEELTVIDPINGLHFWNWRQPEDPFLYIYIFVFAKDKNIAIRAYSFSLVNQVAVKRWASLTHEERKAERAAATRAVESALWEESEGDAPPPFPDFPTGDETTIRSSSSGLSEGLKFPGKMA